MRNRFFALVMGLVSALFAAPNALGGYCTGTVQYTGCKDYTCKCAAQLSRAIRGLPVDWTQVSDPSTPVKMFTTGATENYPVLCGAVRYWYYKNPTYLTDYFNAQLYDSRIGLAGTEIFSNAYNPLILAGIIAARKRAEQLGHTALQVKASQWLKAYFSLMALTASSTAVRTHLVRQTNQATGADVFNSYAIRSNFNTGYGVALPGNRQYVNARGGGDGILHTFLSMALNHPGRKYAINVDQTPDIFCPISQALNIPISGGVPQLAAVPMRAQDFGMTDAERYALQNYIATNGASTPTALLQNLQAFKLEEELTIHRTTGGVVAYFGNENTTVQLFGEKAKGGSYAVASLNNSTATTTYISRARYENQPEDAWVWRESSGICMQSSLRAKACAPVPPGNTVNKINFRRLGSATWW